MRIEKKDIEQASKLGILSEEQGERLYHFLQEKQENVVSFRFSHVLYYLGGLIAIAAMTLFVTAAWENLRGIPLFIISCLLFLLGLLFTRYFIRIKLSIPAGIFATFSLAIVPLAVYNLQYILGYLPDIKYTYSEYNSWISWYWVPMEFATLLVGVILLYIYRLPFLLFIISITLWYMSMDLYALVYQTGETFWWRATFSMYFGLVMLLIAIYMDLQHSDSEKDFAFWLYMFGMLTFWGGLTCQSSDSELSKLMYCLLNVFLIFVGVFLRRRVFAVFGAFGILAYLSHLAFVFFADSMFFPLWLVFIGFFMIFLATRWQRFENKLTKALTPFIPKKILDRHK